MTIPEIIKQAHENAVRRGFYICRDCGGKVCNQCNNFSAAKLNVYHDIKKELETVGSVETKPVIQEIRHTNRDEVKNEEPLNVSQEIMSNETIDLNVSVPQNNPQGMDSYYKRMFKQ